MDAVAENSDIFVALNRLIAATDGFVTAWGAADPAMLERLESFAGWALPADFRAFALRYGNANVGYIPVRALGPVDGRPAAQALTEERRSEWRAFPPDAIDWAVERAQWLERLPPAFDPWQSSGR